MAKANTIECAGAKTLKASGNEKYTSFTPIGKRGVAARFYYAGPASYFKAAFSADEPNAAEIQAAISKLVKDGPLKIDGGADFVQAAKAVAKKLGRKTA
ncbi:MAG: hypothetical protein LBH81_02075 [Rickettsiales bacterium]|jgi:hypothetical protein|nr:hypothetical protein [Rickettsiales bacterium]